MNENEEIAIGKIVSLLEHASNRLKNGDDYIEVTNSIKVNIDVIWQDIKGFKTIKTIPYWSENALLLLSQLEANGDVITRNGKRFERDHVVPKIVHVRELIKLHDTTKWYIRFFFKNRYYNKIYNYLEANFRLCVIDKILDNQKFGINNSFNQSKISLHHEMPDNWTPAKGPWTRYEHAQIKYNKVDLASFK